MTNVVFTIRALALTYSRNHWHISNEMQNTRFWLYYLLLGEFDWARFFFVAHTFTQSENNHVLLIS